MNGPPQYTTTVNRSGYLLVQYLIFKGKIFVKINKITFIFLVPVPPSQLPLDPRAQGHKRKIIAYDDL